MTMIEEIYSWAKEMGLLQEIIVGGEVKYVHLVVTEDEILKGLVSSVDYDLQYPASWLTLKQGDVIMIHNSSFRVKFVQVRNRDEMVARVERLP